ncbi:MAG: hypothetical protein WC654_07565, partial [Patescibacteria group bacterium]
MLSTKVLDVDRQIYLGVGAASGTRWITVNGTDWDAGTGVGSESGFFNSSFDPSCAYSPGVQYWKMGTTGNSYYKDVNSSTFNLAIKAPATTTISQPISQTVNQSEPVLAVFKTVDECNNGTVGASVTLFFETAGAAYSYDSGIYGFGNGTYNYSFDTTGKQLGTYNFTVMSSKNYYSIPNATLNNAFIIARGPELQLPSVNMTSGGWGETWGFSVECRDTEGDQFNVTLWKRLNSTEPWTVVEKKPCQGASFQSLLFVETFSCSDISGQTEYKFNATDQWGYGATTGTNTINLEKDDVSVDYLLGQNAEVGREGASTALFRVRVRDADRNNLAVSSLPIFLNVTTNGVDFALAGGSNNTESDGNASYFFDPTCSYSTGSQKWQARVSGAACYKDKASSNYTLFVYGQLKNAALSPAYTQAFNVSQQIILSMNASSDCASEAGIGGATPAFGLYSPLGQWETCGGASEQGSGVYNCSWNSSGKKEGNWTLMFNSSKQYYYSNSSNLSDWFYLDDASPSATGLTVSPSSGGWSRLFNYSVNVNDVAGDNVSCKLFVSTNNGSGWSFRGQSFVLGNGTCFVAVHDFSCADIGDDNKFLFQISDVEASNSFNTSIVDGPNFSASSVQAYYVQGNNTQVNRSSGAVRFGARFYDSENQSFVPSGTNASLWVTTDGSNFGAGTFNTTNSTGFALFDFDPSCSYNAGVQNWTIGAADGCYQQVNSSVWNTTIFSDLRSSLLAPSGQEILKGSNVSMRLNVSDDCSAGVVSSGVNVSGRQGTTNYFCSPIIEEGSGIYNCSLNTSAMSAGWHNVSANHSKQFYNFNSSVFANKFFVETAPTISSELLNTSSYDGDAGPSGGYGEAFNFTVRVTDSDNDTITANLYARKSGGSWQSFGVRQCTNCSNTLLFITKTNFACGDISGWEYLWNATEDDVWNASTSSHSFSVESDDVEVQYFAGNESVLWRNGTDSAVLSTKVWDVDNQRFLNIGEASGTRWVTTNGASYDSGSSLSTDFGGFFNSSFDPSCSYRPGVQYWKTGTTGNSCFKDANSSAF